MSWEDNVISRSLVRKVPGRRMWELGVCVWVSVLGVGKGGKGGGKGVGAKSVGNLRERV